jgi:peptidoglycan hydrolase FlgJ
MSAINLAAQSIVGASRDMSEMADVLTKKGDIKKKAQEFESMFLQQMMTAMFGEKEESDMFGSGGEDDGMFGGGESNEIYRGWMAQQYGDVVAKNGGIGIASYIERELIKLQEV